MAAPIAELSAVEVDYPRGRALGPFDLSLEPGEIVWMGADTHVYLNHEHLVAEQVAREPKPFPRLSFTRRPDSIFDYRFEDFEIVGYQHHPAIRAAVAV